MNPELPELQRWMLDALVAPHGTDGVGERLTASPTMDPRARLAIYQRSYILRLAKCLAEQFPALAHALGAPLFDDFAREYLAACPSDAYTLYELGRRFPGWLETSRPDRALSPDDREDWIDFMVDLARYERELFRLFDAPGHEGGVWPTADVPDARLVLQPCFALAQYRYPVAWYYQEVRHERAPRVPPRASLLRRHRAAGLSDGDLPAQPRALPVSVRARGAGLRRCGARGGRARGRAPYG